MAPNASRSLSGEKKGEDGGDLETLSQFYWGDYVD